MKRPKKLSKGEYVLLAAEIAYYLLLLSWFGYTVYNWLPAR